MKVTYTFDTSDEDQKEDRFIFENAPRWWKEFESAKIDILNALRSYNKEYATAEEALDEIRDIMSELPDTEVYYE